MTAQHDLLPTAPVAGSGRVSPWRANYILLVLALAFMIGMIDRVVLALLIDPIQADLKLSDTEMGLLSGLAFASFYLLMSVPIGRLADRFSRKRILLTGIALWSVMTALCGIAQSATHLFLARMGVGAGESALGPAAYSIMADVFPRERLARAYAIFGGGALIGSGAAMIFGGWVIGLIGDGKPHILPLIGVVEGWQAVFILASLPGFFIMILMLTIGEPARRAKSDGDSAPPSSASAFWRFLAMRWQLLLPFFIAFGCLGAALFGALSWLPSFLTRAYHLDRATTGLLLGLAIGIASPAGAFAGGYMADRLLIAGRLAAPMIVGLVGACGALLLFVPLAAADSLPWAIGIICALFFFLSLPTAAGPAGVQMIAPQGIKAQVIALYIVATGLSGMTLGSLIIGALTDHWFADRASVGWSIALFGSGAAGLMVILFAYLCRPFALRAKENIAREDIAGGAGI